ncbi:hypothetical protein GCM10023084_22030 [Streptomyces lacrimifluminis]|uniref:Uncharacterized protein n=1 Tax=Streptomyces lacrimifluminis TaxID=1500077 RepID=A0A917KYR1_9ACTN|nr:hypothetical protein GCM10012282_36240 [Streptomyces lacrimifluminis]
MTKFLVVLVGMEGCVAAITARPKRPADKRPVAVLLSMQKHGHRRAVRDQSDPSDRNRRVIRSAE